MDLNYFVLYKCLKQHLYIFSIIMKKCNNFEVVKYDWCRDGDKSKWWMYNS